MGNKKKYSDEVLIEAYIRLNNIWRISEELGNISGQYVWERLKKLGMINKSKLNSKNSFKDWEYLKEEYPKAVVKKGGLDNLAKKLGRTKSFICRKAKQLGLTDNNRKKQDHISDLSRERFKKTFQGNHPKGSLGMKHTSETKNKLSKKSKENWLNPLSKLNSKEHRQKLSDRMSKTMQNNSPKNPYSRTKSGKITIADKQIFVRSAWEANVAAYLQFLKENGEIKEWEYEVETFWFLKIKRGVRSYKPDFKITNNDGSFYFIEVKGWMDDKSKTKLKRMRIYYPSIKIEVLDKKRYSEISKSKALFKYWGQLD